MPNEKYSSELCAKLGIRALLKPLIAEPDYVRIAIRWYKKFESTGSNDARLAAQHFVRVAQELDQVEVLDDFTLEIPCPSSTP